MVIKKEYSRYLKKIENKIKKENLLHSKYLMIGIPGINPSLGFFALYINQLGWIDYALQNKLIPVVDMQNYRNVFQKEEEHGIVNSYEMYFYQPCGVSVNQALKEKNIRYIWSNVPPYCPNDSLDFLYNKELVSYYAKLAEKYMPFKEEVKQILEDEKKRLFPKNCRTLGVLARGTDYTMLKPYYHPVQPTMEMIIEKVNKYKKDYACDKVYVATEDQNNLDALKNEFGDDLLYIDQPRLKSVSTYLNLDEEFTKREPYQIGLDNLKSIYLLSKCNGLIAGRTSGTVGAMVLSKGYEFAHIFSLGRYGKEGTIIEEENNK
ncbi:MAG: hypothetical protein E7285_02180 [Lachnospiraceae bacterium]|nr:hypothetical protein [Lachnospiraceae bacterium]